jgi:hypothetical protein
VALGRLRRAHRSFRVNCRLLFAGVRCLREGQ